MVRSCGSIGFCLIAQKNIDVYLGHVCAHKVVHYYVALAVGKHVNDQLLNYASSKPLKMSNLSSLFTFVKKQERSLIFS